VLVLKLEPFEKLRTIVTIFLESVQRSTAMAVASALVQTEDE
jgi:hypothetical protein